MTRNEFFAVVKDLHEHPERLPVYRAVLEEKEIPAEKLKKLLVEDAVALLHISKEEVLSWKR